MIYTPSPPKSPRHLEQRSIRTPGIHIWGIEKRQNGCIDISSPATLIGQTSIEKPLNNVVGKDKCLVLLKGAGSYVCVRDFGAEVA